MKTQVVGHSTAQGVVHEARILNRIVRATCDGWEYECDQRHVETNQEQLEMQDAKPLSIPGVDDSTRGGGRQRAPPSLHGQPLQSNLRVS